MSRCPELIIFRSTSLVSSAVVDTSIIFSSSTLLPSSAAFHVAGKSYKWIIHSDLHVSILTLDTADRKYVNECGFRSLDNSTSKRVLDLLEPVKLTVWKVVVERITVVKFRMDNGAGCFEVKIWADIAKFTDKI